MPCITQHVYSSSLAKHADKHARMFTVCAVCVCEQVALSAKDSFQPTWACCYFHSAAEACVCHGSQAVRIALYAVSSCNDIQYAVSGGSKRFIKFAVCRCSCGLSLCCDCCAPESAPCWIAYVVKVHQFLAHSRLWFAGLRQATFRLDQALVEVTTDRQLKVRLVSLQNLWLRNICVEVCCCCCCCYVIAWLLN